MLREDRKEKNNQIFHWEVGDKSATDKALQEAAVKFEGACAVPALPSRAAGNLRLCG